MAVAGATVSLVSAAALAGSPLFIPAAVAGAVLTVSCLFILFFRPDETALFLLGQPPVSFAWSASPFLSAALESLVILAFLLSIGGTRTSRGKISTLLLMALPWLLALVTSGSRHASFPLVVILAASGVASLVILGYASHIVSRVIGGLHEASGSQ